MRIGYIRSHNRYKLFFLCNTLGILTITSNVFSNLDFFTIYIFGVFRYSIEFFSCRIFRHMFPPFCNLITSSIPSEAILGCKIFLAEQMPDRMIGIWMVYIIFLLCSQFKDSLVGNKERLILSVSLKVK